MIRQATCQCGQGFQGFPSPSQPTLPACTYSTPLYCILYLCVYICISSIWAWPLFLFNATTITTTSNNSKRSDVEIAFRFIFICLPSCEHCDKLVFRFFVIVCCLLFVVCLLLLLFLLLFLLLSPLLLLQLPLLLSWQKLYDFISVLGRKI